MILTMLKRHSPLEILLFAGAIIFFIISKLKINTYSKDIIEAAAYGLLSMSIVSKLLRFRKLLSNKQATVWTICAIFVFQSGILVFTILQDIRNMFWVSGLLVFVISEQDFYREKLKSGRNK